MKVKNGFLSMKALDGSLLILKGVEGYYVIGFDIVVVQFKDGGEKYYTNFKVLQWNTKKW